MEILKKRIKQAQKNYYNNNDPRIKEIEMNTIRQMSES